MTKKQQKLNVDLVAGLCGLFFTVSGVSAVYDALYRPLTSWDWKVGVGLIIFGSMIMGVAFNKMVVAVRKPVAVKRGRK